jgi:MerR family redox-sensitive transcriptional activator SoxR
MASNRTLTIGEVAERVGLATSALRFYERQGLITAGRTDGGQRRFSNDVVRRVSFIKAAQAVGISLSEVGSVLDGLPSGRAPTRRDWERAASKWRPRLDARIEALVALRDRLDGCIGCGCLSLDTCALYNPEDAAASLGAGPRYLLGDNADDLVR